MTKKEFALAAIKPYFDDPTTCGVVRNKDGSFGRCAYYTPDGKMCVLGKFLQNPEKFARTAEAAEGLLNLHGQKILKPEAQGILTNKEWQSLQGIHDMLSTKNDDKVEQYVRDLGLFTMDELMAPAV